MIIETATAGCGCTKPEYPQEPVLKGKTATIKVTYNAANMGAFTKTVTVKFANVAEPVIPHDRWRSGSKTITVTLNIYRAVLGLLAFLFEPGLGSVAVFDKSRKLCLRPGGINRVAYLYAINFPATSRQPPRLPCHGSRFVPLSVGLTW